MKIFGLILILSVNFYSCVKDTHDLKKLDANHFKNTWIFHRFVEKTSGDSYSLPDNYSAEFTFHGPDCIYVIGPCNSGPGKYMFGENKITITSLAMTERGCEIIGYEDKFTDNLSGQYTIKGDTLTIISDFNTDLILIKADSTKSYDCYNF